MTTPNSILAEACAGTIDGISAIWGPSAVNNLSSSAQDYDVNRGVLKRATENVAVKCAKRIGKTFSAYCMKPYSILGLAHIHRVC
jgi:hypothetical protein